MYKEECELIQRCILLQENIDKISDLVLSFEPDKQKGTKASIGEIKESALETGKMLKELHGMLEEKKDGKDGKTQKQKDLKRKNVLLAFEKGEQGEEIKKIFENRQASVFWTLDGKKALDAFCYSRNRTFDLILVEAYIPEKDGFLVSKAIRASQKPDAQKIPIVALLNKDDPEEIRKAKDAGMSQWIFAPYEKEKLEKIADELLAAE